MKQPAIIAVSLLLLLGCEGSPPPMAGPASGGVAATAAAAAPRQTTERVAAPQLTLKEADFKEGEAARDPFRRLLDKPDPPDPRIRCDSGKLRQYGLDELKLTGIVGGGARPVAMFRGPGDGTVTTVRRGDRIGKTCGRIKAILRDKVIVTIQVAGSDQLAERVIPLHTS